MDAVIFDMDGVIVDSEHQWKLQEAAFFKALIPDWTDGDQERMVGRSPLELHEWLVKEYGFSQSRESFLAHCQETAMTIYRSKVSRAEGLTELLDDLKNKGVAFGLASSSPKAWIDIVLTRFDLARHFAAVVSADDVPSRTKPKPDSYLLAASRLRVPPRRCVAIEDSAIGVRAAKAAGMACVGIRNGANEDQDLSEADWVAAGLTGLSYQKLISLLSFA